MLWPKMFLEWSSIISLKDWFLTWTEIWFILFTIQVLFLIIENMCMLKVIKTDLRIFTEKVFEGIYFITKQYWVILIEWLIRNIELTHCFYNWTHFYVGLKDTVLFVIVNCIYKFLHIERPISPFITVSFKTTNPFEMCYGTFFYGMS